VFKRRKPDEARSLPAADTLSDTRFDIAPGRIPAAGPSHVRPADSGLGVPPFRPQTPQQTPPENQTPRETQNMGRAPFPTNPAPVPTPQQTPAATGQAVRPLPQARPTSERRTLVVGRGISVQGTVQDAERLVVEGTVEASMIHATELAVSPGGVFKGEVEVEDAEVAGTIDGTLTVRGNLIVRSTGRVLGTARCRRLQVEDGGHITGRIEMLTEGSAAKAPDVAA